MSTVNAPQPESSGPAEVFDSKITGSQENPVSSVGSRGPSSTEGPIHAGANNGIDPYFHQQFIALRTFTWSVNQDPGALVFSVPVHPSECHQWMAHLAKMYNVWDGGIDFAVKIAGTGFHAGALMCVRLPPNINPNKIRSTPEVTAFEYSVIDPKTLEVICKTVMDQRHVMYHFTSEYDLTNPRTFGGFFAIYVLLPLNTSATGSSEIAVQVFAKPASNFRFSQLRPIQFDTASDPHPPLLVEALKVKRPQYLAASKDPANYILVLPKIASADFELMGCARFGTPREGSAVAPFAGLLLRPDHFVFKKDVSLDAFYLQYQDEAFQLAIAHYAIPVNSILWIQVTFRARGKQRYLSCLLTLQVVEATEEYFKVKQLNQTNDSDEKSMYINLFRTGAVPGVADGVTLYSVMDTDDSQYEINLLRFVEGTTKIFDSFTPPLPEAIMFFARMPITSGKLKTCQTVNISSAIAAHSNALQADECFILEMWDEDVNLPLRPCKLYASGVITTLKETDNVTYSLLKKNYSFKIISRAKANVPLTHSGKSLAYYSRNQAVSNMSAIHIAAARD